MNKRDVLLIGILMALLLSAVGYTGTTLEAVEHQNEGAVVAEYTPHAPVIIHHDNFTGWPGSGTSEDPYVIAGLNITGDVLCIGVFNTSSFFVIQDCILHYKGGALVTPVDIYMSNNSQIKNCIIRTHWVSISVQFSYNCNISGNVIVGTIYTRDTVGMTLADNRISSESVNATKIIRIASGCVDVVIYNNTIDLEGVTGISVMGMEIYEVNELIVQKNFVKNVNGIGIYMTECPSSTVSDNTLWQCKNAMVIWWSDLTTVEHNLVYECGGGIQLNTDNCTVINNSAFRNTGVGIVAGEYNCTIYNNFVGFNTHESGQAMEVKAANYWDDGVNVGNYWSDYDGISDNYTVSPGLWWNGMDHYPQVFVESTINDLTDREFEAGDVGHYLSWTSDGTLPVSYELMRNGEVVESDVWDGSVLTFSLHGLPAGVYEYKLTTHFESQMDVSDEVTVTVASASGPEIDIDGIAGATPYEVVEVTATVTDMSGVAEVFLSYTVDEVVWTNITMTLYSDQWVAEILGQPDGTVVGYRVYAKDTLDNWAVSTSESYSVNALPAPDPMTLYLVVGAGVLVIIVIAAVSMKKR